MRNVLTLLLSFIALVSFSQTSLAGKLTDAESGDPIILGTIALFKNGVLATGTETDFDGFYSITEIEPGTYDVEFSYTGYGSQKLKKVEILMGRANKLDGKMRPRITASYCPIIWCPKPLVELDNTTQGMKLTSDQIRHLPFRGH